MSCPAGYVTVPWQGGCVPRTGSRAAEYYRTGIDPLAGAAAVSLQLLPPPEVIAAQGETAAERIARLAPAAARDQARAVSNQRGTATMATQLPPVRYTGPMANSFQAPTANFIGLGDIWNVAKKGWDILTSGDGGKPAIPGTGLDGGPCIWPMRRTPTGQCVLDLDPGAGTGLPGGGSAAGSGPARPQVRSVQRMECPTFANGKKGILWMDALRGDVYCLPRGVNGTGFGLMRKNKPRPKPYIRHSEIKALKGMARTKKKAKDFARLTGQTCAPRGGRGR